MQHSDRGRMDRLPSRCWSEGISAPRAAMQCGNATGGRAFVCVQHALRRTSLTCKISKMILIPPQTDVHPSPIVAVAKAAASPNLSRQQCGPQGALGLCRPQDVPVPQITLTANGNEINGLARWLQLDLTRTPYSGSLPSICYRP